MSVEREDFKLDFIIIGSQKSGTSSLDSYLRRHPEIGMSIEKEIHFFDNEEVFSQPKVDYSILEQYFRFHPRYKVYGETTPIYLYWFPSIRRIWEYSKDIKLIAVLRNPILRAYSQWNMQREKGLEKQSFIYCIKNEILRRRASLPFQNRKFSYVDRGLYAEQIRRVKTFFPDEQLLFIKYEDFLNDQLAVLNQVFRFVGVDKNLYRFSKLELHKRNYPYPIGQCDKQYLLNLYMNDICEVERLLGWNCDDWKE